MGASVDPTTIPSSKGLLHNIMTAEKSNLVWHYTDGSALINILTKNELWASSAAFMNDMNELLSGNIALREHFEERRTTMAPEVMEELEKYIPDAPERPRQSFVLSASSDGDNLTMWRYYGRDEVSFAVGLDRNVPLLPLQRLDRHNHPNPPPGYYDDMYDKDEAGEVATYPDGSPIVLFDPDSIVIESSKWSPVVYSQEKQKEIIAGIFDKLYEGVSVRTSRGEKNISIWLFPYLMNESLDLIKNPGFRDEQEERIITWPNPDWKFVFHRPGPYGLVPYIKLTSSGAGANSDYATEPNKLPIREIRIGPTAYRDEAVRSLKQLLEFNGLHDVRISYSNIPFR